ncbi:hypothetical protein DFH11DRAFT_1548658 [Phellopilus nigrolimitatus]|nr:hypothetical protein DFH11DRAFT_1548658 [Phellopilus nigrolimitatus]
MGWDAYQIICQEVIIPDILKQNITIQTKHQEEEVVLAGKKITLTNHYVKLFSNEVDEYLINAHVSVIYREDEHRAKCGWPEITVNTPFRERSGEWPAYINERIRKRIQTTLKNTAKYGSTTEDYIQTKDYNNDRITAYLYTDKPPPAEHGYTRRSAQTLHEQVEVTPVTSHLYGKLTHHARKLATNTVLSWLQVLGTTIVAILLFRRQQTTGRTPTILIRIPTERQQRTDNEPTSSDDLNRHVTERQRTKRRSCRLFVIIYKLIDELALTFYGVDQKLRKIKTTKTLSERVRAGLNDLSRVIEEERLFVTYRTEEQQRIAQEFRTVQKRFVKGNVVLTKATLSPSCVRAFDRSVNEVIDSIYTVREHANVLEYILQNLDQEHIHLAKVRKRGMGIATLLDWTTLIHWAVLSTLLGGSLYLITEQRITGTSSTNALAWWIQTNTERTHRQLEEDRSQILDILNRIPGRVDDSILVAKDLITQRHRILLEATDAIKQQLRLLQESIGSVPTNGLGGQFNLIQGAIESIRQRQNDTVGSQQDNENRDRLAIVEGLFERLEEGYHATGTRLANLIRQEAAHQGQLNEQINNQQDSTATQQQGAQATQQEVERLKRQLRLADQQLNELWNERGSRQREQAKQRIPCSESHKTYEKQERNSIESLSNRATAIARDAIERDDASASIASGHLADTEEERDSPPPLFLPLQDPITPPINFQEYQLTVSPLPQLPGELEEGEIPNEAHLLTDYLNEEDLTFDSPYQPWYPTPTEE